MDSKLDFTKNIIQTLKTSKLSITPHNNEVNLLYLSRVKTLKRVLEQNYDNNNLDKLIPLSIC
ncbi:MAG: hypothetical protein ACR2F1_13005 [Nitrososphaeraceae archaeon]